VEGALALVEVGAIGAPRPVGSSGGPGGVLSDAEVTRHALGHVEMTISGEQISFPRDAAAGAAPPAMEMHHVREEMLRMRRQLGQLLELLSAGPAPSAGPTPGGPALADATGEHDVRRRLAEPPHQPGQAPLPPPSPLPCPPGQAPLPPPSPTPCPPGQAPLPPPSPLPCPPGQAPQGQAPQPVPERVAPRLNRDKA